MGCGVPENIIQDEPSPTISPHGTPTPTDSPKGGEIFEEVDFIDFDDSGNDGTRGPVLSGVDMTNNYEALMGLGVGGGVGGVDDLIVRWKKNQSIYSPILEKVYQFW